ncbi:MAG: DUF4091 domain-containing protein [Candidatus Omnitrophota bacterium]|jgi:hypothetical protein|nr:MAG: DUF4091 domain-containing protein [Candidatus Omnitrophota bacterium]
MTPILLSFLLLIIAPVAYTDTPPVKIRAVPDTVRIDPQTGRVFEDSDAYPFADRWKHEYKDRNSVWREDDGASISLWGGRNEYVAAQIVLERTGDAVENISISISDLHGPETIRRENNIALFKEWYIEITRPSEAYVKSIGTGWYPEVLIPLDEQGLGEFGMPFSIPDKRNGIPNQQNQLVWIDIFIPKSIANGFYEGSVVITGGNGNDGFHVQIPLKLEVLDFSLPDTFHLAPSLNTYGQPFQDKERTIEYFQIAHQHRCLCESFNPKPAFRGIGANLKLNWEDYDRAMSPLLDGSAFTDKHDYYGPGTGRPISRIYLPFTNNKSWLGQAAPRGSDEHENTFKEALRQFEAHFAEKGWEQTKLVFFINDFDETKTIEGHEAVVYYGNLLWSAGLKDPSRFAYRFDSGAFRDVSHHIPDWTTDSLIAKLDVVNMWVVCGAWRYISADGVAKLREKGKEAWFYFSNTSGEPCIGSCYIDAELIGLRTWPWICWRYDLTSACIWEWTYGAHATKRWTDPWTGEAGAKGNGDACLIYDGKFVGIRDLCPSLRLKSLRRGAQDYEYLWLLANECGKRDVADELVRELVPAALDEAGTEPPGRWKHDPEAWERIRRRVGMEIVNKQ